MLTGSSSVDRRVSAMWLVLGSCGLVVRVNVSRIHRLFSDQNADVSLDLGSSCLATSELSPNLTDARDLPGFDICSEVLMDAGTGLPYLDLGLMSRSDHADDQFHAADQGGSWPA